MDYLKSSTEHLPVSPMGNKVLLLLFWGRNILLQFFSF